MNRLKHESPSNLISVDRCRPHWFTGNIDASSICWREMSKGLIAVIKAVECRLSSPSLSAGYEDISEGWSASDNDRNWWARVNNALRGVIINLGLHIVSPSSSRWLEVLTYSRESSQRRSALRRDSNVSILTIYKLMNYCWLENVNRVTKFRWVLK